MFALGAGFGGGCAEMGGPGGPPQPSSTKPKSAALLLLFTPLLRTGSPVFHRGRPASNSDRTRVSGYGRAE